MAIREALPPPPANENLSEAEDDQRPAFNPEIHRTDRETGEPILNKDGSYRLKPGVKKQPTPAPANENDINSLTGSPAPATEQSGEVAAAVILAGMIESSAKILISPAWAMSDKEREGAVEAWIPILEKYNISDLPPSLALLGVYAVYASSRISKDKQTRSRLGSLWDRLCGFIGKIIWRRRLQQTPQPEPEQENNDNAESR